MSEQPTSLSTAGRRTVAGMEERDTLRAEVAALAARVARLEGALAGLVGCIATSAADNGPPITRNSMMAQVCKVLQRTAQYEVARAALEGTDAG